MEFFRFFNRARRFFNRARCVLRRDKFVGDVLQSVNFGRLIRRCQFHLVRCKVRSRPPLLEGVALDHVCGHGAINTIVRVGLNCQGALPRSLTVSLVLSPECVPKASRDTLSHSLCTSSSSSEPATGENSQAYHSKPISFRPSVLMNQIVCYISCSESALASHEE